MNRKFLARKLSAVHRKFVESIDDAVVKERVKNNTIITGGSIVSHLLNETPNDYDMYFTEFDTAKAVADYYVAKFIERHPGRDIQPKVVVDNGRIKIKIQSAGIASETQDDQLYLGTATLSPGEYVDNAFEAVAAEEVEEADDLPADLLENEATPGDKPAAAKKYEPVFFSQNAITLKGGIQLIIRFYGDAAEIHKNFDFVHCTGYWLSKTSELILPAAALESILTRQLQYTGSLYPLCSIIRTRKFIKRGWHINAGQYLKMCFQLSKLNLADIGVLEDQLTGVDTAYFRQLIEACQEKLSNNPDFIIDELYLTSIVDKLF